MLVSVSVVPDLALGSVNTQQVSWARGTRPRAGQNLSSLSADGRYGPSLRAVLVRATHTLFFADVFVRETLTGTRPGQPTTEGRTPTRSETTPSTRGRPYVAFTSFASDLIENDGAGNLDVFVRDLAAGTTAGQRRPERRQSRRGATTRPSPPTAATWRSPPRRPTCPEGT